MLLIPGNVKRRGTYQKIPVVVRTLILYAASFLIRHLGFDTLLTRDITKSSAMQRAGRAGREVCTTFSFITLPLITTRDPGSAFVCIQRMPLTSWRSPLSQRSAAVA